MKPFNPMIIDIKKDAKEAEEWENSDSEESISMDEIVHMAKNGVSFCEDYCASREYTGENRCYCIRSRFPTPSHYELYLLARDQFKKYLALGMLAMAVDETVLGEKDDDKA